MSKKKKQEAPKRKVTVIDMGFGHPDDPIFKEGWTVGPPLMVGRFLERERERERERDGLFPKGKGPKKPKAQ